MSAPEPAGAAGAAAPEGVCAICLEPHGQTWPGCGRGDCGRRFCAGCLDRWFGMKVEECQKFVLPVPCPGLCGRPVPATHWAKLMVKGREALDAYAGHARDLLCVRCHSCEATESLFAEAGTESGCSGAHRAPRFAKVLNDFQEGALPASELLAVFTAELHECPKRFEESGNMFFCGSGLDQRLQRLLREKALHLIPDVERRCALQLEALRRYPKIYTPCCGVRYCWNCKAGTHHEGISCEDFLNGELAVPCQRCPSCNAPTEKVECPGTCATVRCACGHRWRPDTCK